MLADTADAGVPRRHRKRRGRKKESNLDCRPNPAKSLSRCRIPAEFKNPNPRSRFLPPLLPRIWISNAVAFPPANRAATANPNQSPNPKTSSLNPPSPFEFTVSEPQPQTPFIFPTHQAPSTKIEATALRQKNDDPILSSPPLTSKPSSSPQSRWPSSEPLAMAARFSGRLNLNLDPCAWPLSSDRRSAADLSVEPPPRVKPPPKPQLSFLAIPAPRTLRRRPLWLRSLRTSLFFPELPSSSSLPHPPSLSRLKLERGKKTGGI